MHELAMTYKSRTGFRADRIEDVMTGSARRA